VRQTPLRRHCIIAIISVAAAAAAAAAEAHQIVEPTAGFQLEPAVPGKETSCSLLAHSAILPDHQAALSR